MKTPSFISPYVEGNSPTRLFQGLAVGIVGTLIVGFSWGGWQLGSTGDENVANASRAATVKALAPICAEKFEKAASADNDLVVKLAAVDSWQRGRHLMEAGWATFPGAEKPIYDVADACAKILGKTFKFN